MNNNISPDTLALRDIHLPEPVSLWPVASGWWLLLAGIIVLLVIAYLSVKHYRKRQLKRDIKFELDLIKQQYSDTQDPIILARSLSILMRRAGISIYAEHDVAGLIGDNWLAWLDETQSASSGARPNTDINFLSETGRVLLTAPYMPDDAKLNFDANSLITLCESWLFSSHSPSKTSRSIKDHSQVKSV